MLKELILCKFHWTFRNYVLVFNNIRRQIAVWSIRIVGLILEREVKVERNFVSSNLCLRMKKILDNFKEYRIIDNIISNIFVNFCLDVNSMESRNKYFFFKNLDKHFRWMKKGKEKRKRDEQRQFQQLIYDRALICIFFRKISSKTAYYFFFFFLRLLSNASKHSDTSVKRLIVWEIRQWIVRFTFIFSRLDTSHNTMLIFNFNLRMHFICFKILSNHFR